MRAAGNVGASALAVAWLLVVAAPAATPDALHWYDWSYFAVQSAGAAQPPASQPAATPAVPAPHERDTAAEMHRGVDEFFNVREAYTDVARCEWKFAAAADWATFDNKRQDHVFLWQTLKYGITDTLHAAVTVVEPLGYGGDGVGELKFRLFNTCWKEADILPAFGSYLEIRTPTGYESSNVDGRWGGILTKTICRGFRAHLEGWVETSNGEPGWFEDAHFTGADRRNFQWAVGPGVDWEIAEGTLLVLNYLNRVSEAYGEGNDNVLEGGLVHTFARTDRSYQQIKLGVDVGLCDKREEPNLGAKLLWQINLR
jgi:hypothetical protein